MFCEAFGHEASVSYSVKDFEYTLIDAYKVAPQDDSDDVKLEVIGVSDYYAIFNFLECK